MNFLQSHMTKKYKILLHERIEEFMKELNEKFDLREVEGIPTTDLQDNEDLKKLKNILNIKQ
jgi:hypothetical protein